MSINIFKNKITVAVHSGDFHADDVFACATLSFWAGKEGKIKNNSHQRPRNY